MEKTDKGIPTNRVQVSNLLSQYRDCVEEAARHEGLKEAAQQKAYEIQQVIVAAFPMATADDVVKR